MPLVRAEIADACKSSTSTRDCDELKSLKKLIMANIDKRLILTDSVTLVTLLDSTTKCLTTTTQLQRLLQSIAARLRVNRHQWQHH